MPVQSRSTAKYIRFVIPKDLHGQVGRGEIVRSLRTKSHHEAALRRHPFEYSIRCAFDIARADPMVDRKKLNELVNSLADAAVERMTSELGIRSNLTPDPAKAWNAALARRSGTTASAAASASRLGTRLSESVAAYCAHKKAQKAWTERTEEMHRGMFGELVELLGDPVTSSIMKADMLRYQQDVARLPVKAPQRWPGLDARAVIEKTSGLDVERLSPKSINKRLTAVKSLFKWLELTDEIEKNPSVVLQAVSKGAGEDDRSTLTDAEVTAFLALCDTEAAEPAHRWLPRIAAYSGLRLDEIGQLDRDDIVQVDGIWSFRVTAGEGRKIKTRNSARLVPIHSSILSDLLAYRESRPKGNLWGLKKGRTGYTANAGKWLARRLDTIIDDRRKTFHSFRHTVPTKLKALGVEEYLIAQLLGHANANITTGRYGKAVSVQTLQGVVERITY